MHTPTNTNPLVLLTMIWVYKSLTVFSYNSRSDMWALGCVLYNLCSLHHPFEAQDFGSLVVKITRAQYTPLPRYGLFTVCRLYFGAALGNCTISFHCVFQSNTLHLANPCHVLVKSNSLIKWATWSRLAWGYSRFKPGSLGYSGTRIIIVIAVP